MTHDLKALAEDTRASALSLAASHPHLGLSLKAIALADETDWLLARVEAAEAEVVELKARWAEGPRPIPPHRPGADGPLVFTKLDTEALIAVAVAGVRQELEARLSRLVEAGKAMLKVVRETQAEQDKAMVALGLKLRVVDPEVDAFAALLQEEPDA